MKTIRTLIAIGAVALVAACGRKKAELEIQSPEKFDGEEVSLVSYDDSTVLVTGVINGGKLNVDVPMEKTHGRPMLIQLMIGGKTRGFYVAEPGKALYVDSMSTATGTAMNDKFTALMAQLDSVDNLDDLSAYTAFAEKLYNENRDSELGLYFFNEYVRFANVRQIDSLLITAPQMIKSSHRKEKGLAAARLRDATSPGAKYIDFAATQPDGKQARLSDYVGRGKPVLVDFWASWCPYCIKEMPELKEMYAKYKDKGLEIVGVAVRDEAADTRKAVDRFGITWPVIYNAQRIPYDIYGFAGIPHHILIDGNGIIVSRGENAAQLNQRLEKMFKQ